MKVVGGAAPKPRFFRGLCLRRRPLALGQVPGARGLADGHGCIAHLLYFSVADGGCRPHAPAFSCARLVLKTALSRGQRNASSVFLSHRWGLPPPHPRFRLRSACLAEGLLPRRTKRFFRILSEKKLEKAKGKKRALIAPTGSLRAL
jgi:hypothetical protein